MSKITRQVIQGLKLPDAPRSHYYVMEAGGRDSLVGFGLHVYHSSVRYVVRRRRVTYPIDRADLMPLEEARKQALALLRRLDDERSRPELSGRRKTVAELATLFLTQVVAPKNKARTLAEYRRIWRLHLLPRFGALRLPEVTPELVLRMKHELADKPVAANRALQQLAAAFAFGRRLRWVNDNPADEKTVDRNPEAPETRSLRPPEYRRLGAALREAELLALLPPRSIAAIRLLLLTGARPNEILSAELAWLELDPFPRIKLPTAKRDRPGKRPKGRSIWLPPAAVDIIQAIPRPPGSCWMIPGDKPGHPLWKIGKAWALVCELAGIEGSTPKSARHSYRSAGPSVGVAPEHMRELMGHTTSKMTDEVYWHADAEDQTRAARIMGEHLAHLLEPARQEPPLIAAVAE